MFSRFTLDEPVCIDGRSLIGFRARVVIEPIDRPGWWLKVDGHPDVEIGPHTLTCGHRHLGLAKRIKIVDHLLAIRLLGLDRVRLSFPIDNLVPFWGTGSPYISAVEHRLKPNGTLRRCTLNRTAVLHIAGRGRLEFVPSLEGSLEIEVEIDYPKEPRIGRGSYTFSVTPENLKDFAESRALGHLPAFKHVSLILSGLRWPHQGQWVYAGNVSPEEIRVSLAKHRVWDLLGALAVAIPAGSFPEGRIRTFIAGHQEDVDLIGHIEGIGWHFAESIERAA